MLGFLDSNGAVEFYLIRTIVGVLLTGYGNL